MIVGIDVGGTKTLVASFDESSDEAVIARQTKFPTPDTYGEFLKKLPDVVTEVLGENSLEAIGIALPGPLSKDRRSVSSLGNKNWKNITAVDDLKKLFNVPVALGNDAKLAALSEANHGAGKGFESVLYITLSTGIGAGYVRGGSLPEVTLDMEIGHMVFVREAGEQVWEDFASGRALVERFGKTAEDLEDEDAWREYAADVALGINHIDRMLSPDVYVIGGPVGAQLHKFEAYLEEYLNEFNTAKVFIERDYIVRAAAHPEEAVVLGCFYAAQQAIQ